MNPADGYQAICEAIANAWRLPESLSVSDWADAHRILPQKAASEPGPWRTTRTPYLREIMDVLSAHHPAERVVFMKSSQVGGTEAGNNWIGYVVDHAPAPMLCVGATVEMAELWSKQRIAPMVEDTPALRKKIAPARSRDSGNTTLLKEYPGGVLRFAGANSASALASMPAKYLFVDEVDRFPLDVDGEGDPVTLAQVRSVTFARRKLFLVSTPTVKGVSKIEKEFEQSDQRRYYVPCPDCGGKQSLKWSHLRFEKSDPLHTARYACEHCGVLIEQHCKSAMLEAGEWIAENPTSRTVGFHINALYSPVGLGKSWGELATWFLQAKDDPATLKSFINTALGEVWETNSDRRQPHELKARAEDYALRAPPKGCLLITAGVDVQVNRLAVQIIGWGRREIAWVLDWIELPGDPTQPEVWQSLDALIDRPMVNAFGVEMRVRAYGVDSGFLAHDVYNYCRMRRSRGAFPTKGHSQGNRPIIGRPTGQDVNWRGKTLKHGVDLFLIGADTAKSTVFARIDADAEAPPSERRVHFSKDLPDDYYEQLTAEVYDPEKNRWLKLSGRRNEATDTMVLAYAAALYPSIRLHMIKDHEWAVLESKIEPVIKDLFVDAPVAQSAPEQPAPEPRAEIVHQEKPVQFKRKNFANNWRLK